MSDIEQRLQRAGEAWRAEQTTAAAPPARRRGSRWLPAAAAAAVVALALGAVAVGERTRDGGDGYARGGSSGSWERMPLAPLSARLRPVMASWGDRVVVVGGRVEQPCPPTASCARDLRETQRDGAIYDVRTRAWTRLPDAPLPLDVSGSVVVGDVLYLWLPEQGAAAPTVLALDLVQRSWHRLPQPPSLPGAYLRLVAAGGQLVAHYTEVGRADAVDLMWVPGPGDPDEGRWEPLPVQPFGASFDRSMVWTGETLVLLAQRKRPQQDSGPPFVVAAVLDGQSWRVLPEQQVVIFGATEWSWTGERVVSASTLTADGGQTNGFGRAYPSGGYLDPEAGTWSELPPAPEGHQRVFDLPYAAGGRWVANGEGLVLDAARNEWVVLPEQPDQADQDASAAWAAGRLVVWGGATGTRPSDPHSSELARLLATGAVWTPPQG